MEGSCRVVRAYSSELGFGSDFQNQCTIPYTIKPDGRLNALLNVGWDLWKDVVRSPVVENESFVYLLDDEQAFMSKSDVHKRLIELFAAWIHITQQITSSIVPQGYSLMQLHHFVNTRPESPVPDSD